MLPNEFIREDVKALRIAQGMKPDPKMVISNWVKRGLVVRDESRGVCVKVVSSQLICSLYETIHDKTLQLWRTGPDVLPRP